MNDRYRIGLWLAWLSVLALGLLIGACSQTSDEPGPPEQPSGANADALASTGFEARGDVDWTLHGNDPGEKRFSTLDLINRDNVNRLGLAFEVPLQSTRGIEATPIMVDGTLYLTSTWSRVLAVDAVSGAVKWRFDPQVPRSWARRLCCDVVNRGVAVWGDRVIFGTLDGRLISLNRASGEVVWEIDTLIDRNRWYSITGAPRIVKDKVIIGNGGAEYGVRGYVSAYAVDSGELAWRFFTVPGDPEQPFEHPELQKAAATWEGVPDWSGLGGTVWDSMAYDAEQNLLYVGTGNGSPWSRDKRSAGGGDNLFLASILALNPDTGELVWHYQTTPGDNWDYTATQQITLADLMIDGEPRKVLMQAPKNGFFYVLDRTDGELISAEPFVHVNWASHVDPESGRPVETGLGEYNSERDAYVFPSPAGGHNWQPMSFSEATGLVYIPTRDVGWVFTPEDDKWFTYGVDNLEELTGGAKVPDVAGHLKAWDPRQQKVVWQKESTLIWNGGVLSTAGGLVFYGTAAGELLVLDDRNGETLNTIPLGTGVIAPPITYAIDGVQYVALAAGWGGPAFNTMQGTEAAMTFLNSGRLLVFKLDGGPVPMPAARPPLAPFHAPDLVQLDSATLEHGRGLYGVHCGACHGFYGSTPLLPDLRRLTPEKHALFSEIVIGGALEANGMPNFSDTFSEADVLAIQAYVTSLAREAIAAEAAPSAP
ncbi:MAG: PQQ-dependent dehydrogenase, methanol/ethanol family [Pseudomonadota bacterium]